MNREAEKEKERAARFKALREELETQIEEDLNAQGLGASGDVGAPFMAPATGDAKGAVNRAPTSKGVLEALLFASNKPIVLSEIRKVLSTVGAPFTAPGAGDNQGAVNRAPTPKEIETMISELRDEYNREIRSFEIVEIAGGWQLVTRKQYAVWLNRLELQKRIRQASRSALETLAILAYKQPVTRAEIEELRGVDIAAVLSTLLERGFVKITGKKEVAGRPFLYGTTEKFLEHFGLKSLKDLPAIEEIKGLVERAVKKEELLGTSTDVPAEITPETQKVPGTVVPGTVWVKEENEPEGSAQKN